MIEHAALLKSLADEIDGIDISISHFNDDKKALYDAAREAVAPADFRAWKEAIKLRQKRRVNRTALEAHDALVWRHLSMLEAGSGQDEHETPVAPIQSPANGIADEFASHVRARLHDAREETNPPAHDPVTGEIYSRVPPPPAAEQAAAGLPMPPQPPAAATMPDLPAFLDRRRKHMAESAA